MRLTPFTTIACVALAVSAAHADQTKQAIAFDKGQSTATVEGGIVGDNSATYTLAVRSGQALTIALESNHVSCLMNVWAPGADKATHRGAAHGNAFATGLARGGNYEIQVYLMRHAARRDERCQYTLRTSLARGGKAAPPTPVTGREALQVAIDRCLDTFGTPADVVQKVAVKSGVWKLLLQERGTTRQAHCTIASDGRVEDWAER